MSVWISCEPVGAATHTYHVSTATVCSFTDSDWLHGFARVTNALSIFETTTKFQETLPNNTVLLFLNPSVLTYHAWAIGVIGRII